MHSDDLGTSDPFESTGAPTRPLELDSTASLVDRARQGDSKARELLAGRYLPALRRFAHGRLPAGSRSVFDTDDVVQVSLVRVLGRLDDFENRHPGSLLAYLRRAVLNAVLDEARREARTPDRTELSDQLPDPSPSPLEQTIGRESLARYERALANLPLDSQEAIMMRLEMGCSYAEIAASLGRPSAEAARQFTSRAVVRLVESMREREP